MAENIARASTERVAFTLWVLTLAPPLAVAAKRKVTTLH